MKLIIFDLDQTLVDFIPVHDEVANRLFNRFFGVGARLSDIDFAGRSLKDNMAELARRKHVPEVKFQKNIDKLLATYDQVFAECIPRDASKYILPGAIRLLEELSRTDNLLVLYTGDSPGIVTAVFNATGLGRYFKFAVYGTEFPTRADMVRHAIERAEKLTGREFKNKDIVIIGDSVRDVECGKLFNAITIAVATGFHSREKLSSSHPDYLFNDLIDFRRVLVAIGVAKQASGSGDSV